MSPESIDGRRLAAADILITVHVKLTAPGECGSGSRAKLLILALLEV
jgi:hypothetical protein